MLIRSNTLNEFDGIRRSKLYNEPVSTVSNPSNRPIVSNTAATTKPPQNRYEALFIKLFAQTTLQLILAFTTIFFLIVIIRDFIGLKINFLKISFWFQFSLNLTLFVALIFAKIKCISNANSNPRPLGNPIEYFFNQDQLILIGIWTATAFNFGSWYFRQYAPHIYKLFDQVKGKYSATPVLREQYFLIWATLLSHGIVSWASSMYFSTKFSRLSSKTSLVNFLKSRIQDFTFWPGLLNRSALIYLSLIMIHFTCSWIAFPIFGLFISTLIDINQPIRHSWFTIFRFGIFVHSFTFSIISNLIFSLIDWLIEFYLGRTFRTCSLVPDFENCLTIGLCQTKQSFIHLQACYEFLEIVTESNSFRRYKIFSAVQDEGSLSREILDWFSKELDIVKERSEASIQELNSFSSILGNDNIELPNPEVFKQYREKTIGLVELILKKVFTVEKPKPIETTSTSTAATTTPIAGLPEVFARRGPVINVIDQSQSIKKDSVPLIFEFGPFLKKNSLGKLLISNWIASRKIYPIENFEILQIVIKSIGSFICASFLEDETGQVQLALPRVLETSVTSFKSLQSLLETTASDPSKAEIEADKEIEIILNLLKEMLKEISQVFGETLENVRISSKCREFIQSL